MRRITRSPANARANPACGRRAPCDLADHGGNNLTVDLLAGSPAIDLAVLADCPHADQRGVRAQQQTAPIVEGFYFTERESTAATVTTVTGWGQ